MSDRLLSVWCWRLGPEQVLGRVAFRGGGVLETTRRDISAVLAALKGEIERGGNVALPEIEEVGARRMQVDLYPSRRTEGQRLSASRSLQVTVDVGHARLAGGVILVDIPTIGHVGAIGALVDLQVLVPHLVREHAALRAPEQVFRAGLRGPARLETTRVSPLRAARATPAVKVARLSRIAEQVTGPPEGSLGIWEREDAVYRTRQGLYHRRSFVVVGASRSGRSAVLYEACRRARRERVVFRTHAERLVAGAKYLGDWQLLVEEAMAELQEHDAMLWIEGLPRLLTLGGSGAEDSVAAYLVRFLAAGVAIMGEVTVEELTALRVALPPFAERLGTIVMDPLNDGSLDRVRDAAVAQLAARMKVVVDPGAARLAQRLLDRHVRHEAFPGKLIRFLVDLVEEAQQERRRAVDDAAVLALYTRRTGMPAILVDDRLPLTAETVDAWMASRVVAQPAATSALRDAILTFKAGLNDPGRPIATLLFAGPTGVGKTASARALAAWCFGSDAALVRVDMSECQNPGQVARLIGTTHGEPGELIRKVRERPFSVVLFDEVEKAHPVFFDILLSVLDEGTMTDAIGRVTDFRGCVVILTTNLGTRARAAPGFSGDASGFDSSALRRHFRPEMLNRIDRVVAFSPLDRAAVRTIAERELAALSDRPGFAGRRLQMVYGESLIDRVARAGFDPALGARPLHRVVEHVVVAALTRFLLEHPEVQDTLLVVEDREGEIVVG